jgi:hypothetical protein
MSIELFETAFRRLGRTRFQSGLGEIKPFLRKLLKSRVPIACRGHASPNLVTEGRKFTLGKLPVSGFQRLTVLLSAPLDQGVISAGLRVTIQACSNPSECRLIVRVRFGFD